MAQEYVEPRPSRHPIGETSLALFCVRRGQDGSLALVQPGARLASLLGVDAGALREDASRFFGALLPDDAERLRRVFEADVPWQELFRLRSGSGVAWLEAHAEPLGEPDGSVLWHGALQKISPQQDRPRQTQELLSLLILQMPVSLAMFDKNMVYLATSNRWVEQFGRGARSLLGYCHYDIHPDLPEEWLQIHRECLAGASRTADEDLWVRGDGVRIWVRWEVHPWRDELGEIGGIIILAEDITSRKEAEIALNASEQRYRTLVDLSPDAIFLNRGERFDFVNPAAVKLFGATSAEQLLGRPIWDILAPEEHRRAAARIATVRSGGSVPQELTRVVGLDGSSREVETVASAFLDAQGQAVLVVVRDATERQRSERALLESERRFRQIAESIREVFWLADSENKEIIYVSPAYEAIWGQSRESLRRDPANWLATIHPEDRARVTAAAAPQRMIERFDEQYRIVRPDGAVRWIHDRAFPVRDEAGHIVRLAGVAEDVTERNSLELQLRQAQKMEAIGQLAGGVAHDFNNLLTVIISSTDLLLTEPDIDPNCTDLLEEILDAGSRGASLTAQLLAFSRREVNKPQIIDLAAIVSDTEKMLRRLIGEDIRLITSLPGVPALVNVDPGQWSQVLVNLAVNARDAMPEGGRLEIEIRSESAGEAFSLRHPGAPLGPQVVLEVRDTGAGMSPETRARIFEPFFTTKERGKGTGLGLAVVYGVVRQSGGHVEVKSELGEGTSFSFYLPAATAPASAARPRAPAVAQGSGTILLVEDDESVRQIALRILRSGGYEVLCAESGQQALALLRERGSVDLLLTDVVMPAMSGPTLADSARKLQPDLRVLYSSGYLDNTVVRHGIIGDDASLLPKPYTPTEMLRRVREVLRSPPAPPAP